MDPVTLALAKGYTDSKAGAWQEIRRVVSSGNTSYAFEFTQLPEAKAYRITGTGIKSAVGVGGPRYLTITLNNDESESSYAYGHAYDRLDADGVSQGNWQSAWEAPHLRFFEHSDYRSDGPETTHYEMLISRGVGRYAVVSGTSISYTTSPSIEGRVARNAVFGLWRQATPIHTIRIAGSSNGFVSGAEFILEAIL